MVDRAKIDAYLAILDGQDRSTYAFLDKTVSTLRISDRAKERIKNGFIVKIGDLTPEDRVRPISYFFFSSHDKKVDQARNLANNIGYDFSYVDCREYELRQQLHESDCSQSVLLEEGQKSDDSEEALQLSYALQRESFGIQGWILGAPRGYVVRDVNRCLAETAIINPYQLVFFDRIENCSESTVVTISDIISHGTISGARNANSVRVSDLIFVFSTDIPFSFGVSEEEVCFDMEKAWKIRLKQDCPILGNSMPVLLD